MKKILSIITLILALIPGSVLAQGNEGGGLSQSFLLIAIFTVLGLTIIVLVVVVFTIQTFKKTLFEE